MKFTWNQSWNFDEEAQKLDTLTHTPIMRYKMSPWEVMPRIKVIQNIYIKIFQTKMYYFAFDSFRFFFFKNRKINVELHFDSKNSHFSWSQNFINAKACDQYKIMNASLEQALPIFISVHNDWNKQIVATDSEP